MDNEELGASNRAGPASVFRFTSTNREPDLMKQTKPSPGPKRPLPLHWVEDDGFEVRPIVRPAPDVCPPAGPPRIVAIEAPLPSPVP